MSLEKYIICLSLPLFYILQIVTHVTQNVLKFEDFLTDSVCFHKKCSIIKSTHKD